MNLKWHSASPDHDKEPRPGWAIAKMWGCLLLLAGIFFLSGPAYGHQYFFPQVRDRIKQQVEAEIHEQGFSCRGEIICGLQAIPLIYQGREFAPMWFDVDGLRPMATTLVQSIRQADREGLNPADYHLEAIEALLNELSGGQFPPESELARQWADLDLMLTDAYLLMGAHMTAGRINPENLHKDWLIGPRSLEMVDGLGTADTPQQIREALKRLNPIHQGYADLKVALQQMREISAQGGWPQLPKTPTLRPGQSHEALPDVRLRLVRSGDLETFSVDEPSQSYGESLAGAVMKFQTRHGLDPDGVIGPKTRDAMNVTVEERIRQIELNLERWRWLPRDLGDRHIIVNTAAFYLRVMEHGRNQLEMRVVVGRPARQSPVFSADMTYMVLNPYWNVPRKLAVEDILPKLEDGVEYLIDYGFKVFTGWSKDAEELDPQTVSWEDYSKNNFPFRLRQDPGKKNALGEIKFMFPNKFAVYLHDTPKKSLFKRVQRGFSSGCIRVEDAHALAGYLLSDNPAWSSETLLGTLEEGNRRVVRISRPIPVHLHYMTAWVDEDGILQFRKDIYKRDSELDQALRHRDPYPIPSLTAKGPSA